MRALSARDGWTGTSCSGIVAEVTGAAGQDRPSLRFGLVGTGYWARVAHAPALASAAGIEFTGVWGRDPRKAGALATTHHAAAHSDYGAFLADVDAVAFSVPPDVQGELALRAAHAGKHLLLEKPLCTEAATARALAQAVDDAEVASVVFFTARFQSDIRAWLANAEGGGWAGGQVVWLGSALAGASPFNTPWRQQKGGLWDLGPHALSLLWPGLGPVQSVTARGGACGVSHLILRHEGGATSTVTVTLEAAPADDRLECYLWGRSGRSAAPALAADPVPALRQALAELVANVRAGATAHPCDVRFAADVTLVLVQAQQQIDERRADQDLRSPPDARQS